jgi:hypothetical protein
MTAARGADATVTVMPRAFRAFAVSKSYSSTHATYYFDGWLI